MGFFYLDEAIDQNLLIENMIDYAYLQKGLAALAQAHTVGSMSGHLGAAVLAGYFVGEDHADLDDPVHDGLRHELDRIIEGEETIWYNLKKSKLSIQEMFLATPGEHSAERTIPEIAEALTSSIGSLKQSGHNVIFGSLALRALHDHPEMASPQTIDGIVRLMHQFDHAAAGRGYYGKERGWITGNKVKLPDLEEYPHHPSLDAMVERVLDLLIHNASKRRQGFGGLFHIINHAAALSELAQLGYTQLAVSGLNAHHHHIRLYLSLPVLDEELGTLKKASVDPFQSSYWQGDYAQSIQWSGWLTHRIKTIHGFHHLLNTVQDDAKRQDAADAFLYLMA